jgi:hypothetical protein
MSELSPTATHLAAAVAALTAPVFVALEEVAGEVGACLARTSANRLSERDLSALESSIAPRLAAQPILAGMGYVAAPGVVGELERYMMWWQRSGEDLARLRLNFDPSSIDVYDYLQMEWFQSARDRGERTAYGPYIDYSGSGLYVLTVSVPVTVAGLFLGVAGADVEMAGLERRLVSVLRTSPHEAVVVNSERRVLAVNTARWVVGERFPALPVAEVGEFADAARVPGGSHWWVGVAKS